MLYAEHPELLEEVAESNGVDVRVVRQMLDLAEQFPNLHAYGARPALRRKLTEIVDEAIRRSQDGAPTG